MDHRDVRHHQVLPGSSAVLVDGFRLAARGRAEGPGVPTRAFVLSHFHSDHYTGLHSQFFDELDESARVFASETTAALVVGILRVPPRRVVAVRFNVPTVVLAEPRVVVTLIPANHCPGAAVLLFEGGGRRVLHCGDCRFDASMLGNAALLAAARAAPHGIDEVMLDTTFASPKVLLPSQAESIETALAIVGSFMPGCEANVSTASPSSLLSSSSSLPPVRRDNARYALTKEDREAAQAEGAAAEPVSVSASRRTDKALVLISTYNLGKERLLAAIARTYGLLVYAPPARYRMIMLLGLSPSDIALFTTRRELADIHIVSMDFIGKSFPYMQPQYENLDSYLAAANANAARAAAGGTGAAVAGAGVEAAVEGGEDTDGAALFARAGSAAPASSGLPAPAYTRILGLIPTGMIAGSRETVFSRGAASVYLVPYSEHSSFAELQTFVGFLRPVVVTPTVFSDERDLARIRDLFKSLTNNREAERRGMAKLFRRAVGPASTGRDDPDVEVIAQVFKKRPPPGDIRGFMR